MNRVIISTNYKALAVNVIDPQTESHLGIENLSDDNATLYLNISSGKFDNIYIDTNLILTKDKVNNIPYDFRSLGITENDYLLHHSQPNNCGLGIFKNRAKGMHERHCELYPPVFKIIFDKTISPENKADKIIEELFGKKRIEKLFRQKTDFLYSIYKGNKPENIQIPEIVKQASGIAELIQYFNDNPYLKEPGTDDERIKSQEQNLKFNELRSALGIK